MITNTPFPISWVEDQITRSSAAFYTTKLGERCSRFYLLMIKEELSLQHLTVFQRDRWPLIKYHPFSLSIRL